MGFWRGWGIVGEVVLEVPGDWRSGGQCPLTHRDEGLTDT
jgi:hypothetical protein